jgi:hypothetical protein
MASDDARASHDLPSGSTTPLYHGGLADLVRGLVSEGLLYLSPSGVPITRANIFAALAACERHASTQPTPRRAHCSIAFFSCVPYVLKLLVEDGEGQLDPRALTFLQGLEMLGVGGAPLARVLGDALVEQRVRLVSRYGSAECGFLMSSARNFEHDGAWQYLRNEGAGDALKFEPQAAEEGEDVAELVVLKHWPCMVGSAPGWQRLSLTEWK